LPPINAELVRALLDEQFPRWRELPIRVVQPGGNDHRTFRLGERLSVRLPSAPGYVPQVAKEQEWLPVLAPQLPLAIPEVEAVGVPSPRFPAPWSVYGWIDGEPASTAKPGDSARLATDLARFLVALRAVDRAEGPEPGLHSAFRGGPVGHWDDEVQQLLSRLHGQERPRAATLWREALAATVPVSSCWFHGDVAAGNLLVRDGVLVAVLDFGCAGVGDPACDTVVAWTMLDGPAKRAFRDELGVDEATWARGRGWALWKALIMLTDTPPGQAELARHVLDQLLAGQ